jgi:hypothetical protein
MAAIQMVIQCDNMSPCHIHKTTPPFSHMPSRSVQRQNYFHCKWPLKYLKPKIFNDIVSEKSQSFSK